MRSHIFALGLLVLVSPPPCAVRLQQTTPVPTVELATVRDPDEYAVWSVLLTEKYVTGPGEELVIENRTTRLEFRAKHFLFDSGALSDLKTKSQAQYVVENRFKVSVPCTLISQETENGLFHFPPDGRIDADAVKKIQDGWHQFYKVHPDAPGIVAVSRVGFNSDKGIAVVYIVSRSSMMIGRGVSFLLAKKNGSWEIDKEQILWIS